MSKAKRKETTVRAGASPKRKFHKWADIKARHLSPEQQERVDDLVTRDLATLNLQALRKQLGVTQAALAEAAGFAQGEVSRIEQRADHMVSTLRRVVTALGGELEIHARFPDGRDVRLVGV